MKVRLLRRAQADLLAARDWLAEESPAAAAKIVGRLLDGLEQLEEHPRSGPVVRDQVLAKRGYRCLAREGHLVFYRLKGKQVLIYRVLHGRVEWRKLV